MSVTPDVMMAFISPAAFPRVFAFSVESAAYNELNRETSYRFAEKAVVGNAPQLDAIGPGLQRVTLNGRVHPHYKVGNLAALPFLRTMVQQGKPVRWVDALGLHRGQWVLKNLREKETRHFAFGLPLTVEFTLELLEYRGGYIQN